MTEEKLREIIQRMIDNNEPEEKIREVVRRAREMMVETPVEEEVVQEEVVEEPVNNDNVDWDAVNEMSLKLNLNGDEVEEEVLMTEDELNAPIGQVDIYANRKPTEVEMKSDVAVSQNIVGNETLQQYEDIQSSPLRKAEAEAQQIEFDEKGGQYSIENLDHFVSPENQGIVKNAVAELDEMNKDIEAGTNENFQKKLLEQIMAHENAERHAATEGELIKLDVNDPNVAQLSDHHKGILEEQRKPENQFKALLEETKIPTGFDPGKWEILQEWKANGFISKESLNSLDPNVVTSVKNQYKRTKLNDYFHANDDLTKDKRKYVTALLAEQTPGDLGYSDVLRMENDPEYKALKLEQQEEGSKAVINEMKEIQAVQEKPFGEDEVKNADYFKITGELTATSKKLNELTNNGINKYSSTKDLEEYNKTLTEYQTALKAYNVNGYGEVVKSQATRIEAWSKDREKLMNNAIEMNNVGLALELGSKNYSHLEAAKLSLTKAAFDVFGQSLLQTAGMLGEGMEYMRDDLGLGGSASMYEMEQFLQEVGGVGIDAERSYREYQEEAMAPPATFEGAGFDEWLGSTFAEGIPSVATVISLIYGPQRFTKMIQKGAKRKLIKQGASKKVVQKLVDDQKVQLANVAAKSSKLTQGIFFGMSYSGKAVDMALQQQDAPEKLKKLRESLAAVDDEGQPLLNAFERNQALSEIESLNNVMDWTVLQRAGSSLLAGGVEMYAEKLGTLGYMKNLNRIAAPVKAGRFKRMMYTGLNTTINAITEQVEETATQMANNLSDIYILGEDKSVIDGINAEFFAKVAVTSLAIQGPQIGGGIWNSIQSEVISKREAKENMQYLTRLLEVEDALSNPIDPVTGVNLTRKQIDLLRAEKKSILKSAAFGNVVNTQKLARMSMDEKKQLFEFNRERRKILNQLNEIGML